MSLLKRSPCGKMHTKTEEKNTPRALVRDCPNMSLPVACFHRVAAATGDRFPSCTVRGSMPIATPIGFSGPGVCALSTHGLKRAATFLTSLKSLPTQDSLAAFLRDSHALHGAIPAGRDPLRLHFARSHTIIHSRVLMCTQWTCGTFVSSFKPRSGWVGCLLFIHQ